MGGHGGEGPRGGRRAAAAVSPLTCETPVPGVFVHQRARGYRYALDPFLLAGWVMEGVRPDRLIDVGTGSGIIALLLAKQGLTCDGIDVRAGAIERARRSAADSALHVDFSVGDVRDWPADGHDLAVCNPPYFPAGEGHLPPDADRAAARHELHGTLKDLVGAMGRLAPRVALILPLARAEEATQLLATAGRPVRRRLDLAPHFTLLEGCEGHMGPSLHTRAELREGGACSARVGQLYAHVGAQP